MDFSVSVTSVKANRNRNPTTFFRVVVVVDTALSKRNDGDCHSALHNVRIIHALD